MFGGEGEDIRFSAAEEAEIAEINLRVLRRKDPSICAILSQSNHVHVYAHEGLTWEKQEIQGPFFLVQRSTVPPSYTIIVLNKQNSVDFSLSFALDTKFKLQESFLMLRSAVPHQENPSSARLDYGIWFYDLAQQKTAFDKLCEIQARLKPSGAPRPAAAVAQTPVQHALSARPAPVPDAAHQMSLTAPVVVPPPSTQPPAIPPPAYLVSTLSNVLASQMPLFQSLSPTQVREALLLLANDEGFMSRLAAPTDPHHPPTWYRSI